MQVITIDGVRNDEGRLARIGVLGSCRVHGPVKALVAAGGARAVAFPFNTYTHSPHDALQYLKFCLGRMILPPPLEPLVFGKAGMRYPALGFMQLVARLDLIIAEVSSQTRLSACGFEVQQNYFATHFVRAGGKPLLDWWRSVVRGDEARLAAGAELIDSGVVGAPWQQEVVSTAELAEIAGPDFFDAMSALVSAHPAKWMFVSHFGFDADRPIASRERNIQLLKQFSTDSGVGFFDPSPFVMQAGATTALKAGGKDIYHYDPDFEPEMGGALAQAAASVLSGEMDGIERRPVGAAPVAPDRSILDQTDPAQLEALAREAEDAGNHELSKALRHRLLQVDPDRTHVALELALQAAEEKQWRSAVALADHVLAADASDARARQVHVTALDELGEGDPVDAFRELEAEGDLRKLADFCVRVTHRHPAGSEVRTLIGQAIQSAQEEQARSEASDDPVAAARSLDMLAALDPSRSSHWKGVRHGLVQRLMTAVSDALESGDNKSALRRSRQLVDIGANVAESNLLIGRILLERGETAEAIKAFRAATELQPDRAWPWINLARAHLRDGATTLSAEAFIKARDLSATAQGQDEALDTEARQALRSMATALVLRARELEASASVPEDDLQALQVYRLAAEALGDEGDFGVLTTALRRRSLLRVVETEKKSGNDLLRSINVHLAIDPDCPRVLAVAGRHFMRARDHEHALPFWERLAELEPHDARHHLQVARCMDWLGMTDGMLAAAGRCLELDPDNSEASALSAKSTAMVAELE